ncbi:MAG TPA: hypothetical protein PKA63_12280 [Oligoflexia bacterium]|nr:hypothetical protein [Oligoflexia bacterium]HMP49433.1 hypothetical protein [Oligoflexia bacterium]
MEVKLLKIYFEDNFKRKHKGQNKSIICSLVESVAANETQHSSILCNLSEVFDGLENAILKMSEKENIKIQYTNFFFWLYLIVENLNTILDVVGMPKELRKSKFPVFYTIKNWANFIKHPKAFLFTHHTEVTEEKNVSKLELLIKLDRGLLIDQQFVNKYYAGKKNDSNLFDEISNKKKVFVSFPDCLTLLKEFSTSIAEFIKIMSENPIYIETLTDRSIIENYFNLPSDE